MVAHSGGRSEPVGHDGNEAAPSLQSAKCSLKMPNGRKIIDAAAERPRKRRIHEDQGRTRCVAKSSIKNRPIMAGDRCAGENAVQAIAADRIELVEMQRSMSPKLCNEQTVAGAGLENDVILPDICEQNRDGRNVDRSRELLPFDLVFAPHGLSGEALREVNPRGDIGEAGQRRQ